MFNKRTNIVVESINVQIPDTEDMCERSLSDDERLSYVETQVHSSEKLASNVIEFEQIPSEVALEAPSEQNQGNDMQSKLDKHLTSGHTETSSNKNASV